MHPLFLIEEDYRLAVLTAETAFVERFITTITDPDHGWAAAWDAFHLGVAAPESGTAPEGPS